MISKLIRDDKVVIQIERDTWKVWYPLDNRVSTTDVNEVLGLFDIELREFQLQEHTLATPDVSNADQELINTLIPNLQRRLALSEPRKPEYAVVANDDQNIARHFFETLFVSQLMVTGEEKWAFYQGYKGSHPTDEDLTTIKAMVFTGSVQSCYDTT